MRIDLYICPGLPKKFLNFCDSEDENNKGSWEKFTFCCDAPDVL